MQAEAVPQTSTTTQSRSLPWALLITALWMTLPCLAAKLSPVPAATRPHTELLSPETTQTLVVEDWLAQARAGGDGISTQTDARGGCDGIKDGKYAFHTVEESDPWWQVDLGRRQAISRLVVFNRLDYAPGLHNADNLLVLSSDDGQTWTLRHENKGNHFGGVSGAPPLDVKFEGSIEARYLRLQIPSKKPIYLHLDEVEVYNPEGKNIALHCKANQSSISQWSTAKPFRGQLQNFPTAEFIERGKKLAKDLSGQGVDCTAALKQLDGLEVRLRAITEATPDKERQQLYVEARQAVRDVVSANPLLNFDRLLFAKRFTQETYPDVCLNHMPWVSRPGGDLCVLSTAAATPGRQGQQGKNGALSALGKPRNLTSILNGALGPGHVHGMELFWDGTRVVFGYARSEKNQPPEGWMDRSRSYHLRRTVEPIHIFEVNVDGTNLRQLTFGEWSDLDPTYAPNGDIVFVSERCGTSLQCNEYDKDETSCNLYVMKPDGTGIRRLSVNKDGDYLPHTLDDGTIAYVRWEYHERSWAFIQSIWTVHPDGTFADAIFKQHFVDPWALEDTRSIPNSRKLVCVAAGHHTLAVGPVVVVDPAKGINDPLGMSIVTPDVRPTEGGMAGVHVAEGGTKDGGGLYSTPWALSEKHFLASYTYSNRETDAKGYGLYYIDVYGNKELIYRDTNISCFAPVPLRARPRPPILAEIAKISSNTATCLVTDVSFGSDELAGKIRYVRVAEPIGWPYDNKLGGQRYGEKGPTLINWTPIRILGDIPVEPDGSAKFEVPADMAVYFQLLDENRMELRRMRSFISFQPGESRVCTGCHETRGVAPRLSAPPMAALAPPRKPLLPPWGDRPVSFIRDIQPILDRQCVSCHSGLKPAGGHDFGGGLTDWSRNYEVHWGLVPGYGFNRAFETINRAQLVAIAEPNLQDASITPSYAYGAHRSKLLQVIESEGHRQKVKLTPDDRLKLTMWMDANAPYHDNFVNKRADTKAYDLAADKKLAETISGVHERRCAACHKPAEVSRADWIDLREAKRSLFLQAPLAKAAGGTGKCGEGVYRRTEDSDYQTLLKEVTEAVSKSWAAPRRDVQSLVRK